MEECQKVNKARTGWILSGNVVIMFLFFLSLLGLVKGSYISGSIFFTFAFYLTYSQSFSQVKFAAKTPGKYNNKKISEEEAMQLIAKLERRVVEQQLYKNPELKLGDLSNAVKISTHQLSQLLLLAQGASYCRACSTCNYCKHFNSGETCGVCSGGFEREYTPEPRSSTLNAVRKKEFLRKKHCGNIM